jgi:hypothetical protein
MTANPLEDQAIWRPLILNRACSEDARWMDYLIDTGQVWRISDTIEQQLHDLIKARTLAGDLTSDTLAAGMPALTQGAALYDFGNWVYYPWSGRLVHVLPPDAFRELWLDQQRHTIAKREQERLSNSTVGIVGLSMGSPIAFALASLGAANQLKLADANHLGVSDLGQARAGIQDIGQYKTVIAARQIYELNPYARLVVFHTELSADTLDLFLLGEPRLDLLVDQSEDPRLQVLLRERAGALRLPMVIESD